MKKEIRKDVREYILSQVNETLARLGVSENLHETEVIEVKYHDTLHYEIQTPAIRQVPMMFKRTIVEGYMVNCKLNENNIYYRYTEKYDVIAVNLSYSWELFGGGRNGAEIGRMVFLVDKNLPEEEKLSKSSFYRMDLFVRKEDGITI